MYSATTLRPTPVALPDVEQRHHYGSRPVSGGTDFVVSAPHAIAVDLCLFSKDGDERRLGMHGPFNGAWSVHVDDVGPGQVYGYRVFGPWNPHEGLFHNPNKVLLDPYARAIAQQPKLGEEIFSHAVDSSLEPTAYPFEMSDLDSADDAALGAVTADSFPVVPGPRIRPEDSVIYEAHVKGLTMQLPGVPEELRGTYAGLAHPVTLAHLRALGVTTIELLPIHAAFTEAWLQSHGGTNYWATPL